MSTSESMIDWAVLQQAKVCQTPFPHLIAPGFIAAAQADALIEDFPDIQSPGSFPAQSLHCGKVFADFLDELQPPPFAQAMGEKFGVDLSDRETMITVHGQCRPADVERTDLQHDEDIRRRAAHLGKGFILPAPIMPPAAYLSECLPTPMSTAQTSLPLIAVAYADDGRELARQLLGNLPRNHTSNLDLATLTAQMPAAGGHVELLYDLAEDGVMDGWLHALFRYTDKSSGHAADTSFALDHMFGF